jgi:hypothetical protein
MTKPFIHHVNHILAHYSASFGGYLCHGDGNINSMVFATLLCLQQHIPSFATVFHSQPMLNMTCPFANTTTYSPQQLHKMVFQLVLL